MYTWLYLALIPIVGGLIGWSTNWIAVKLLFRPYNPIRIPGTPFAIQGVIPKRRRDLAATVGRVVEEELLSIDDLVAYLDVKDISDRLVEAVGVGVYDAVMIKMPVIVPYSIKTFIAEKMADVVAERMPGFVELLVDELTAAARREVKIGQLIEARLNSFPLEMLEQVAFQVASRELRAITLLGGVIGFLIGLIQVVVYYVLFRTGMLVI
ncbi:MAG: DUF445 family protein [Clostridia bacterium]|nr:DUF445 family protein [Clostridia bacterium]